MNPLHMMPGNMHFESGLDFFDWFLGSQGWFLSQSWMIQLLVIIGLVALTVAIFSIVYYVIKGVFYLLIELFKLAWAVISAIFKRPVPRTVTAAPAAPMPPMAPLPPRSPVVPVPPAPPIVQSYTQVSQPQESAQAPQEITTKTPDAKLFCPMCGENFTQKMIQLAQTNGKVFCEYCGNQIEVR